jgi:superfamily I DNA/RNA helicase
MYTWRGAEPDGMAARFDERFPGNKRLILPENYRSTGAIVAYCQKIAPTPTPMRTHNVWGVEPVHRRYQDDIVEAETIISQMADKDNTAILARTNQQLAMFERVCGEREIKYKLLGKSGFFHQEEIQNTLAFAQYFVSPTDACVKQMIKSPYECSRFMKKGEIIESLENAQRGSVGYRPFAQLLGQFRHHDSEQANRVLDLHRKLQETSERIRGKSAEGALRNILTVFGILHHYEDNVDADNNPANNVRTLLRMTEKHSTLMAFVNTCIKAKAASRSTAKRLTLSTIHQAKGKEWNDVYVVGVNHETLPHKNGDPEEEKRIYFVACSRAALHLYVSCYGEPSPFIKSSVESAPTLQQEVDVLDMMMRNSGSL